MAEPEEISLIEELNRLASKEPFVPFVIIMASGERYEIGERDTVAVGRRTITVARYRVGHHILRQSQVSEVSIPGEPS